MDYLNFDLRLEWDHALRAGVAEVLQSPAGEGKPRPLLLDMDLEECAQRVYRSAEMAQNLGCGLASAALSEENLTLWHESYQIARERRRGLRLRLHIEPWELARLPWELMYDARRGEYLVFDPMISVVRYIRLHWAPPTFRQSKSLTVLVVVASPVDQEPLDVQRELSVLREALSDLASDGRVQVVISEHTTHEDLHIRLLENAPDVVHFIGHGEFDHQQDRGFLLLEGEGGWGAPLGAEEAARMLRRYGTNLVVLIACSTAKGAWAGLAPALMRAEIPAVVAMQWPVEDRAGVRFSRSFYTALSRGRSIDECVSEGRLGASASSCDPNDWAAPVLFLRSLSGQIWTSQVAGLRQDPTAPESDGERPAVLRGAGAEGGTPDTAASEGPLFRTRGPLVTATDGDLIIDRPELKRAVRLAQQPSVTQYIALLGARQTGKTTLLFRLMHLLRDTCACVFVDLSVLRAQEPRTCYQFVAFRLAVELGPLLGAGMSLPETRQIESSVDFMQYLRELADAVPVPRIVLLVDEVGALSAGASDSLFNTLRTVFTQGRGVSRQLSKYLCFFSGAVDLYALTSGSNSPLNICEKLFLSDFTRDDVAHIVGRFGQLGVSVAGGAAKRIYEWTAGHPYLTMRICALMEEAGVAEVTPAEVDRAAEELLVEDDNIRHVIRELVQRPTERRRLREILIEGREMPFSRHDPVLASLEMIGAIRGSQPCVVRNRLYEEALRRYLERSEEGLAADALPAREPEPAPNAGPVQIERTYERLEVLRAAALGEDGAYVCGKTWGAFAAALFSLIPAFSIYPDLHTGREQLDIVLGVDPEAPGGSHWCPYRPAILVECANTRGRPLSDVVSDVLERALFFHVRLVFLMVSEEAADAAVADASCSGTREDTTLVLLRDAEIRALFERRGDLDAFLRAKVVEARLRRF
ncbi:MAG: CHAT domain-containing protein [Chloroflexi bacterium]|nr:CHAT domain-containing protein [Chloroflexota bacterium]